jgi:RNA polymerase sigma-70 factor (ECF subfamily)
LVARLVEGMSVEETSALLRLKPATVKTRLHRARTLIKADLGTCLRDALGPNFPFGDGICETLTRDTRCR